MTAGKATALALGLAGAFALGVWTGPYMTERMTSTANPRPESVATTPASSPTSVAPTTSTRALERSVTVTPASAPELHSRLKPVLNSGTNVKWAAEGFRTAEQFATVAHAARNTGVPFAVLKDRVLKGRSLAAAIREFKPEVDAAAEVRRAQMMARGDVAAILG